jgi:hypothetical protein
VRSAVGASHMTVAPAAPYASAFPMTAVSLHDKRADGHALKCVTDTRGRCIRHGDGEAARKREGSDGGEQGRFHDQVLPFEIIVDVAHT